MKQHNLSKGIRLSLISNQLDCRDLVHHDLGESHTCAPHVKTCRLLDHRVQTGSCLSRKTQAGFVNSKITLPSGATKTEPSSSDGSYASSG